MKLYLEHPDFVAGYQANELQVSLDLQAAMHVADAARGGMGCFHQSFKGCGCFIMLAGVVLFFFIEWWAALSVLGVGCIVSSLCRRSAGDVVIQMMLVDPVLYESLVAQSIARVERKNQSP